MRVLANNGENGNVVIEIASLRFDDEIIEPDIDSGDADNMKVMSGLTMIDVNDNTLYIENVSNEETDEITERLLFDGYADIREYGSVRISLFNLVDLARQVLEEQNDFVDDTNEDYYD